VRAKSGCSCRSSMPRMYEFFRQGVRLELRPLKGQRKGPASGEAAGPGRKMPMPWWRAWGRDLRGREEKVPRLGGIRCWPVCRPFLKESFTSCKEVAGLLCDAVGPWLDGGRARTFSALRRFRSRCQYALPGWAR